jgi:hypothetical protein
MTSHESSDSTARADALMCQGAMLVLRARRKVGVADDLAPDVNRLLSAASLELESNPDAIPLMLRRAVVQLAEHLVHRSAIPVPRDLSGGAERDDQPGTHRRDVSRTDHRPVIPYCESMALGRMG